MERKANSMQDFVKKLDFDSDTFENIKKDMNFILQRLISNMQEKECSEGSITLKLDVEFSREYIPNFNPDVSGESREIAKPKFTHKVTSQMQVKGKKEGSLDTEMELFFNPATGQYELRPVADTSQKTIFDSDYGFFGDDPTQKQLGPDIAPDYIEFPALPGDVVDETALPEPADDCEESNDDVQNDSTVDTSEGTQFSGADDLNDAGDDTEITSGFEDEEIHPDDDDYPYDDSEKE